VGSSACRENLLAALPRLLFENSSDFCLNVTDAGVLMKTYNLTGYLIIFSYVLASVYFAPAHLGPWAGLLIGAVYFVFCWFLGGLYLADVLHLGIAHRSLDYKEWFIKLVTVVNSISGLYVDPIAWVNRHRLHHKNSDHDGDPNKLSGDGF
jgi:fatty-acid desaturase